ncbi:(Fe-S)-binding protein [Methylonatrum kenyense]|uniref:(Fe-S)-binding protein n=1 Tax=Methylonatrum kenyense TaxID=455253 RepID=UPI0020C174F9|nr:(Fe-S)-binding protein [Methylonatrum kenyense]MCK8515680.1 (Fe-S)-binding protein [Methylonatrum kenyense]
MLAETTNRVALFATCLVDLYRPSVGLASAELLERAGFRVEVPETQTCCGQPAWNSGDNRRAKILARQTINALAGFDYVVIPSGSCAGTLIHDYPRLFANDPEDLGAAEDLAGRTWELTRFLVEVAAVEDLDASFRHSACYHDACSGLRGLGIRRQPRQLLAAVDGLELHEIEDSEVCCGFGGTFCVKYPEISTRLADDKLQAIRNTGAETVLAGDLGCLLQLAGRLKRNGDTIRAYHVAEILAGMGDQPAIGEGGD